VTSLSKEVVQVCVSGRLERSDVGLKRSLQSRGVSA
jgi:hypothetical protein